MINLSSYAIMGFTKLFRNPILLVSWIMLSSSGLSMILAMGIRVRYVNRYVKPLKRTLGRAGRGTKCAVTSAGNAEAKATK